MEGYLIIKKFSSKRVWVVLDGQQLTYYDHLSLSKQEPKGVKGMLFVKDATVSKFSDRTVKHGLSVKCPQTATSGSASSLLSSGKVSALSFDCQDPAVCSSWFMALNRARNLHKEIDDREAVFKRCCDTLNLNLEALAAEGKKISRSLISRTYKKLCLSEHPDKGGSVENFNKINNAYTSLIAIQAYRDEMATMKPLHYEAIIQKGGDAVGLGISVGEDKIKRQVLVHKVNDSVKIVGISEEAQGEIRVGDAVIGIDNDDCSHWFLSRIRARLGALRVPVGSNVLFTFERMVPLDYGTDTNAETGVETNNNENKNSHSSNGKDPTTNSTTTSANIDTNTSTEAGAGGFYPPPSRSSASPPESPVPSPYKRPYTVPSSSQPMESNVGAAAAAGVRSVDVGDGGDGFADSDDDDHDDVADKKSPLLTRAQSLPVGYSTPLPYSTANITAAMMSFSPPAAAADRDRGDGGGVGGNRNAAEEERKEEEGAVAQRNETSSDRGVCDVPGNNLYGNTLLPFASAGADSPGLVSSSATRTTTTTSTAPAVWVGGTDSTEEAAAMYSAHQGYKESAHDAFVSNTSAADAAADYPMLPDDEIEREKEREKDREKERKHEEEILRRQAVFGADRSLKSSIASPPFSSAAAAALAADGAVSMPRRARSRSRSRSHSGSGSSSRGFNVGDGADGLGLVWRGSEETSEALASAAEAASVQAMRELRKCREDLKASQAAEQRLAEHNAALNAQLRRVQTEQTAIEGAFLRQADELAHTQALLQNMREQISAVMEADTGPSGGGSAREGEESFAGIVSKQQRRIGYLSAALAQEKRQTLELKQRLLRIQDQQQQQQQRHEELDMDTRLADSNHSAPTAPSALSIASSSLFDRTSAAGDRAAAGDRGVSRERWPGSGCSASRRAVYRERELQAQRLEEKVAELMR